MKEKIPYETPYLRTLLWQSEDVITASIVDNDGDYRDWDEDGDTW